MDETAVMRSFNRAYTQRIGVLDDSYLGTGRPLNVSRILFELGQQHAPLTIRELRDRLGLDSGYVSRLTATLQHEGLIEVAPDPGDRRRRVVSLLPAGRAVVDQLESRSQQLAERLLAPLSDRQRERFAGALATADLLIRAATLDFAHVGLDDPLARNALIAYVGELDARFPGGFDPGAGTSPPATERASESKSESKSESEERSVYAAAVSDGNAVAFGGIRHLEHQPVAIAELKRLWTHPDWRGAGLGRRMLEHLEDCARIRGYARIRLDTHGSLREALGLYASAGYREIDRYNDNPHAQLFFEKEL